MRLGYSPGYGADGSDEKREEEGRDVLCVFPIRAVLNGAEVDIGEATLCVSAHVGAHCKNRM